MEALERGLNTKYNQQGQVSVSMEEGECSSEPGEEEYETGCARANYPYYRSLSQLSLSECSEIESSDETSIAVRSTSVQQTTAISGALQGTNESLRVTSSTDEEEMKKKGAIDKEPSVSLLNVDKTRNQLHDDNMEIEDEVDEQMQKEADTKETEETASTIPMDIHAVSESQAVILQDLYAPSPIEIYGVSESQAAVLKDLIVGKPVESHATSESQTTTTDPVGIRATSDTESQSVTARLTEVRVISESQSVILNDLCARHVDTGLNNVHKPSSHKEGEVEMEVQEIDHHTVVDPSSHSPDLFDSANSSSDANDIPVIDNEQLELLKGINGWTLNKSIGFIRLDACRVVHHSSVASFNAPPITKVWLHNLIFKDSKLEFSTRTITGNGLMGLRRDCAQPITETQSQEEEEVVEIYSYQSLEEEEPEQKVFDRWRNLQLPHTHLSQERTVLAQSHEDQTRRVQAECVADGGDQDLLPSGEIVTTTDCILSTFDSGSDMFDEELSAMAGNGSSGHVDAEDKNRRCKRPRTEEENRDSQLQSTSTSSEPTPLEYSLTPYQRPAEPQPSPSTQPHDSNHSLLPPMPSKVASIIQGYWYMQKLQNRRKTAKN